MNTTEKAISLHNTDNFGLLEKERFSAIIAFSLTLLPLLGSVANGIMLCFLSCCVPRNPFTVYMLNMAVADCGFLLLLFSVLVAMGHIASDVNMNTARAWSITAFMFGHGVSQCLLTAMCVERCASVLFPIWYRCHRPKHQSAIVCAFLWLFPFLTLASNGVSFTVFRQCYLFAFLQMSLICLVLLPLMLLSNLFLVIEVCRSCQQRQSPRMSILVITCVFTFLLLSVPLPISLILSMFDLLEFHYAFITIILSTINRCLNPLLYFLVGSLRRQVGKCSIVAALRSAFSDKSEPAHAQL